MPVLTPSPDAIPREALIAAPSQPPVKDITRSLVDHLEELRFRILKSLAWVAVLSVVGWWLSDRFIAEMSHAAGPLIYLRPTEAFMVKLKIAGVLGIFLAVPAILYHAWRYIGIALTLQERRVLLAALPFSYLLFTIGVLLGWFYLMPAGLIYLTSFSSPTLRPALSVDACFDFCTGLTLGMGILFQLPVVLTLLARWGVIDAGWLARYRRHAILGIFLVAGIVTPGPDIVSQLMLAIPTYALFEISILLARAFGTRKDL